MVDQQVAGIKTYLTSKSLHASPEWVEGCVGFFVSEHHDEGVRLKFESSVVRIKWLQTLRFIVIVLSNILWSF
jgi:hypothetical protein